MKQPAFIRRIGFPHGNMHETMRDAYLWLISTNLNNEEQVKSLLNKMLVNIGKDGGLLTEAVMEQSSPEWNRIKNLMIEIMADIVDLKDPDEKSWNYLADIATSGVKRRPILTKTKHGSKTNDYKYVTEYHSFSTGMEAHFVDSFFQHLQRVQSEEIKENMYNRMDKCHYCSHFIPIGSGRKYCDDKCKAKFHKENRSQ